MRVQTSTVKRSQCLSLILRNVFLGLALLELGEKDESEKVS